MIFVLSGMIGYLYWQQTRMLQHIQSLAIVISTHVVPRPQPEELVDEKEDDVQDTDEEDDRVSVKEEELVEKVEGPPEEKKEDDKVDIDELQDKTASQLRDILTKKGIPFGKRDSKPMLIQLLKATA